MVLRFKKNNNTPGSMGVAYIVHAYIVHFFWFYRNLLKKRFIFMFSPNFVVVVCFLLQNVVSSH